LSVFFWCVFACFLCAFSAFFLELFVRFLRAFSMFFCAFSAFFCVFFLYAFSVFFFQCFSCVFLLRTTTSECRSVMHAVQILKSLQGVERALGTKFVVRESSVPSSVVGLDLPAID
jgi:hypothetical protein